MNDVQCLSHTKWECKFHIVWIPKCRRKMLYGQLRKNLGDVLHDLARQKESRVLEGHLQPDHVHNADLHPAQVCGGPGGGVYERQEWHPHRADLPRSSKELRWHEFLGTGYFVSTAGADETVVRMCIRDQEQEDQRLEQLHWFK